MLGEPPRKTCHLTDSVDSGIKLNTYELCVTTVLGDIVFDVSVDMRCELLENDYGESIG